eukprot:gene21526-27561_t
MGHYPMQDRNVKGLSKFYRDCPESRIKYNDNVLPYVDGYPNYVRFPQLESPVLSQQRDLVRTLWEQCFFGRDYEGACLALEVLSEIDSIELTDFAQFVDMLQYTENPQATLKALIQKTIKHRLVKSSEHQRSSLLGIFVEQLLLQGDVTSAHSLLQGRMADPAFTATEYLLVVTECGLDLTMPTLQDICSDPLEMYKSILLAYSCTTRQTVEDSRGNSNRLSFSASQASQRKGLHSNTRQLCRNLLNDLKTAFGKCNLMGRRCPWIDMHAIYVAYLEATDSHRQAHKYIQNLSVVFLSKGDSAIKVEGARQPQQDLPGGDLSLQYHALVARYLSRFSLSLEEDELNGEAMHSREYRLFIRAIEGLTLPAEVEKSSAIFSLNIVNVESLYYALQLYQLDRVTKPQLIGIISDSIESCPPTAQSMHGLHDNNAFCGYNLMHWFLWSLLAELLGAVSKTDLVAVISSDSDLALRLPIGVEQARKRPRAAKTVDEDDIYGGDDEEEEEEEQDVKYNPHTFKAHFSSDRQWWRSSLLSASQLGEELSDSVLEFEAVDLLNKRDESSEDNLDERLSVENAGSYFEHALASVSEENSTGDDDMATAGCSWRVDIIAFRASLSEQLGLLSSSSSGAGRQSIGGRQSLGGISYHAGGESSSSDEDEEDGAHSRRRSSLQRGATTPGRTPSKTSFESSASKTPSKGGLSLAALIGGATPFKSTALTPVNEGTEGQSDLDVSQMETSFALENEDFNEEEDEDNEEVWDTLSDERTAQIMRSMVEVAANGGDVICERFRTQLLSRLDSASSGSSCHSELKSYSFMPPAYLPRVSSKRDMTHRFNDEVSLFQQMSSRLLEILAGQVIVCCHLSHHQGSPSKTQTSPPASQQDSLFVVKGVQMIVENALHSDDVEAQETAKRCLKTLVQNGINVQRAVRIAATLANHDVGLNAAPPRLEEAQDQDSLFNVLHWHTVDAESFPLETPSQPTLVNGAYSPVSIYTMENLKDLTAYARERGVEIIFELDVPGHAAGWIKGKPDLLADCLSKYTNINDYALNPSLEDTYTTIQGVLSDIVNATGVNRLHIGGDEVIYGCWSNDASITAFMKDNNIATYPELLAYF